MMILCQKNDTLETSESILGIISYKVIRKTGCLKFFNKVSPCNLREREPANKIRTKSSYSDIVLKE